jgi:hypothetical protein
MNWGDDRWKAKQDVLLPLATKTTVRNIDGPDSLWKSFQTFLGSGETLLGLMRKKSSVATLASFGATPKSFYAERIVMREFLDNGYGASDFAELGIRWSSLIDFGLDDADWFDYKDSLLSPAAMVKIYKISFLDVLETCDYDFFRLAKIGFTPNDLRTFKATVQIMVSFGMTKKAMVALAFGLEDWILLGLKFEHLEALGVTKTDLSDALGWIFTNKERAFEELFTTKLGRSPTCLPNVAKKASERPSEGITRVAHAVVKMIAEDSGEFPREVAEGDGFADDVVATFASNGSLCKTFRTLLPVMLKEVSEGQATIEKISGRLPKSVDIPEGSIFATLAVRRKKGRKAEVYVFGQFEEILTKVS